MKKELRYQKFLESKQEKLRLEIALTEFLEDTEDEKGYLKEKEGAAAQSNYQEVYGAYLKTRIRPAMEWLIREGDLKKLAKLAEQNWFGESEMESFLALALKQENRAVLLWLLHYKHQRFGFKDRTFGKI